MLPKCTYAITQNEIIFFANINDNADEWLSAYGLRNDDFIVKFSLIDENTLVFSETSFLLAEFGAIYSNALMQ